VFIHGLENDREATWKPEGAINSWPKTALAPSFPFARILTFGYNANVDESQGVLGMMIADKALLLLESLSSFRNEDSSVNEPFLSMPTILTGIEETADHIRVS
jgi:hypothetical protein